MSDKFQDRTMAFAGICQAAYLVQKWPVTAAATKRPLRESCKAFW
jgi:high frequency lysogenization protein